MRRRIRVHRLVRITAVLSVFVLGACGSQLTEQEILARSGVRAAATANGNTALAGTSDAASGANVDASGAVPGATPNDDVSAASGAASGGGDTAATAAGVGTPGETGPIVIASVGNYSGPAGDAQAGIPRAVQIWAAWVNAHGGLFGREVKVLVQDDGGDPARYVSILQDDVQNHGVVAFVGQGASLSMQAGTDYLQQAGVPVFGSDCSRDEWFSSNVYAPQCATYDVSIIGTIRAGVQITGKKRFGYVYCGEAAACATNDRVIQNGGASAAGADLVYRQQISLTQVDFTAECQNAQRANVELMFVAADPNTVNRFWTSCQRQGFHAQAIQLSESATADSNKAPGVSDMIVEMATFPFAGLSGGPFDEYNQALAAFGETNPGPTTGFGWASGKLFELAATRAATNRHSITSASLLEAFHTIDSDNLGGLTTSLTFTGSTPTPARCYFVEQGDGKGGWMAPFGAQPQCL